MPTLTWDESRRDPPRGAGRARRVARADLAPHRRRDEANWTTSVLGGSPDYFDIRNWSVASGARFDATEIASGAKVVVLGRTVVDRLFGPGVDVIGKSIRSATSLSK